MHEYVNKVYGIYAIAFATKILETEFKMLFYYNTTYAMASFKFSKLLIKIDKFKILKEAILYVVILLF